MHARYAVILAERVVPTNIGSKETVAGLLRSTVKSWGSTSRRAVDTGRLESGGGQGYLRGKRKSMIL